VARDADVGAISTQLDTVTQLLMQTIKENQAFNAEMLQYVTTRGGGTAGGLPTVVDAVPTSKEDGSLESHGKSHRPKKSRASQKTASGKTKGRKKRGKKSSLWFGVVAGQVGSLHRSEAEARVRAREFAPRRRRSAAFTAKEAAQDWVAQNLDDPHSSDTKGDTTDDSSTVETPEAAPRRARAMSNIVPPPPVEATAFEFVTRDKSIGEKNEIFGIGMKQEVKLFKALCPKGSSDVTMKALSKCIVDGTALPGKYSGTNGALFEEEGKESANAQLNGVILAHSKGNILTGHDHQCDTGYRADKRISLKYVKTADDLHDLERDLGHAVPCYATLCHAVPCCAVLYHAVPCCAMLCLSTMKLYADLVRELASRVTLGWERVKLDVQYFFVQLKQLRTNCPSRLRCMCKTHVFLRNQKAAKYASLARYQAHFTALYRLRDAANSQGVEAGPCARCKQQCLHSGGRTGCPFKGVSEGKARVAGASAVEHVAQGMTKARACEIALEEVQ
jgi:hypothetical protein